MRGQIQRYWAISAVVSALFVAACGSTVAGGGNSTDAAADNAQGDSADTSGQDGISSSDSVGGKDIQDQASGPDGADATAQDGNIAADAPDADGDSPPDAAPKDTAAADGTDSEVSDTFQADSSKGDGDSAVADAKDLADSAGQNDGNSKDTMAVDSSDAAVADTPANGCCTSDKQCAADQKCIVGKDCVKAALDPGTCWNDGDCGGKACTGAFVCPCNADCFAANKPGTCPADIPKGCCGADSDCPAGQECVVSKKSCKVIKELLAGQCWTDNDCGAGGVCNNPNVCPCLAMCLLADKPGTCADNKACVPLNPAGYGACKKWLGFVFDGKSCVSTGGCDCAPDCASFFPTQVDCEKACGI